MAGIKRKTAPAAETTVDDRLSKLIYPEKGKAPKLEVAAPRPKAGEPRGASARVGAGRGAAAPAPAPTAVPSAAPATSAGRFGVAKTRTVGLSLGDKSLPLKKMDAWSYSRLADWETCPLKAKLKHVDKIKEPGSAAMERGSMIHKLAEDYTNKILTKIPPELKTFEKQFNDLRKMNPTCEEQWAFTPDWKPTGWFNSPWLRVKTDVSFLNKARTEGTITDHKTGKEKEEHDDQLSLYAVGFFAREPKLEVVHSGLWYLDQGTVRELDFVRDQFPELQEFWQDRVRPMMEDTRFPAKPNRLCQWCHFRASNGGPCKF